MYTKTLKFYSKSNIDVTLLLMFTPPDVGTLYTDEFPVAWKVLRFPAGHSLVNVAYNITTAFFVSQTYNGNIVAPSIWRTCRTGKKYVLDAEDGLFSKSLPGDPNFLECINQSNTPANIGIGFLDAHEDCSPVLWKNIAVGDTLKAKVPANMLIYSTSDYRESQMITGDIQSPQVWNQDLQSLADVTYLSVSVNPNTQQVSITQER